MAAALPALKTAIALLVHELGGVDAAASVVGRNPGRISEWQGRQTDATPPVAAVALLEAVPGVQPRVTEALARLAGYRLVRLGAQDAAPDAEIGARMGAVAGDVGALMQTVSAALADGALSETERAEAQSVCDELARSVSALAAALRREVA